MWNNFDFDLSKLGNQLGEALQKARTELDKNVDAAFKVASTPQYETDLETQQSKQMSTANRDEALMAHSHVKSETTSHPEIKLVVEGNNVRLLLNPTTSEADVETLAKAARSPHFESAQMPATYAMSSTQPSSYVTESLGTHFSTGTAGPSNGTSDTREKESAVEKEPNIQTASQGANRTEPFVSNKNSNYNQEQRYRAMPPLYPDAEAVLPAESVLTPETLPTRAQGKREEDGVHENGTTGRERESQEAKSRGAFETEGHAEDASTLKSGSSTPVDKNDEGDVRDMASKKDSLITVRHLQGQIRSREEQLLRQAQQLSSLQQVVSQLQDKNQQLALRSAAVSEVDFETARRAYDEQRKGMESRLLAMTREKDFLQKDNLRIGEVQAKLQEKEETINEIMMEGEKLAKKQLQMENTMRKLRSQIKDLEAEKEKVQQKNSSLSEAVEKARQTAVMAQQDHEVVLERKQEEIASQRAQYEDKLHREKLKLEQADIKSRDAAAEHLTSRCKEAESKAETLADLVSEFKEALERQRRSANVKEESLKQDVLNLEHRCHAAEARHQDLAAELPEATRPLLRQMEAMQTAARTQAEAWAKAEEILNKRVAEAVAKAAIASERERMAISKIQFWENKSAALEAALQTCRSEASMQMEQLAKCRDDVSTLERRLQESCHRVEELTSLISTANKEKSEAQASAKQLLEAEISAKQIVETKCRAMEVESEKLRTEWETERANNQSKINAGLNGKPPAAAGPGYHWELVSDKIKGLTNLGRSKSTAQSDHYHQLNKEGEIVSAARSSSDVQDVSMGDVPNSNVWHVQTVEIEKLRAALWQKSGELQSAATQRKELEATRDQLAEELLASTQRIEEMDSIVRRANQVQKEYGTLQSKYAAAVEMVGERDERLEELLADIGDMKSVYKDQVQFLTEQLNTLQN